MDGIEATVLLSGYGLCWLLLWRERRRHRGQRAGEQAKLFALLHDYREAVKDLVRENNDLRRQLERQAAGEARA